MSAESIAQITVSMSPESGRRALRHAGRCRPGAVLGALVRGGGDRRGQRGAAALYAKVAERSGDVYTRLAGRITLQTYGETTPLPDVSIEDYDWLDIELTNGERFQVAARTVRGSPDNPLSRSELLQKLDALAEGQLGGNSLGALRETLEGFNGVASVSGLMATLR